MTTRDDHPIAARIRDGEKYIPDATEEPYQLIDEPSSETIFLSNGEITVRTTLDALIDAMAAVVFAEAKTSVSRFGDFQLALSNAPHLDPLYERLMYDPVVRGLPWQHTHLWCMEHADDLPNIVKDTICDHADIPDTQVHNNLPEHTKDEETPRIDCCVVDIGTTIPSDLQSRMMLVFATSIDECEAFANVCSDMQVRCFVLQESR